MRNDQKGKKFVGVTVYKWSKYNNFRWNESKSKLKIRPKLIIKGIISQNFLTNHRYNTDFAKLARIFKTC